MASGRTPQDADGRPYPRDIGQCTGLCRPAIPDRGSGAMPAVRLPDAGGSQLYQRPVRLSERQRPK